MAIKPLTLYKLIILYMLNSIDTPLKSSTISDYIIDKGYTDYFTMQKAYAECVEEDFIQANTTYKNTYYSITPQGEEVLSMFISDLSHDIRDEITQYLKANQYTLIQEYSRFTDYKRVENGDYLVTCSLRENKSLLMEINISVATEDEAVRICNAFAEKDESIYQYLIQNLM